ncbi:MAG: PQQ-binding-like beta-propeller repeat protein [Bryobacterales bacterium]|nr:PQQ-binding-like beta-propeller repeat protein [Bryobacterales bacterium]
MCVWAHAQWTQFRGPNGSGVDLAAVSYPAELLPARNLLWKAAVPFGQSSPVIQGDRLYVTATDGPRLLTLSFDAQTGQELWRRELRRAHSHKIYAANDPASPSPAADESGVYVFFADFGLAAYTPQGKERWTSPLGPFKNFYGMAASPVLAADVLLQVCDQQSGSFLLAVDRKTGRPRWKTERTGSTLGWSTPMIFRPAGQKPQIIVLGSTRVDSYYLDTGEPIWWTPVASMGGLGIPVSNGQNVVVSTLATAEPWMASFQSELDKIDKDRDGRLSRAEFQEDQDYRDHFGWLDTDSDGFIDGGEWNAARGVGVGEYGAAAISAGGAHGRLDPQTVVWRFKKNIPYVPSPLVYKDIYYMVRDGGIITALDASTGKLLKEGRTREALGEYYASPVAADGKVFLSSGEGKITVLKAGPQWDVLSVNDLNDEIRATPALDRGRIYVRTRSSLYCFGAARQARLR